MNNKKIYEQLIERARNRSEPGIYESHHIIPASMGGSDEAFNRANLTPREHFLAHLLLYRIYRNKEMALALHRMRNSGGYKINSHLYSIGREEHRKVVSEWSKGFMKDKVSMRNKITGECKLLTIGEFDPELWVGNNYGNRYEDPTHKNKTVFKDSEGNCFHLDINDPIIQELGLKGVGNWDNATAIRAEQLKNNPWYLKFDTAHSREVLKWIPSLYEWYCNVYDKEKPKATGIKRWKMCYNVSVTSKTFTKAFNKFKEGWKPDEQFYEVYNEIDKD